MTPDKLPKDVRARIDLEAKQFAFYNYVTQLLHPNTVFERMDTWPNDARVCYYSILHYMSRPDICWPHKEPTLATEWGNRCHALATVLQEFVTNHEAGLLPDRFVYEKAIKILNDGNAERNAG